MEIKIYTLSSSRNPNEIRYVGKTKQTLKRRLQGHICCAKKAKLEGKEQIELTDKDIQEYIEHQQKEKEKDIIAEDDDDEDSFGSLFSVEVE